MRGKMTRHTETQPLVAIPAQNEGVSRPDPNSSSFINQQAMGIKEQAIYRRSLQLDEFISIVLENASAGCPNPHIAFLIMVKHGDWFARKHGAAAQGFEMSILKD